MLGPIDQDLAREGEDHYQTFGCGKCHPAGRPCPYPMIGPNSYGRSLIEITMVPAIPPGGTAPGVVPLVGTDTSVVVNFLMRVAKPGPYAAVFGSPNPVAVPRLLGAAVREVIDVEIDQLKLDPATRAYLDNREDKSPTAMHLGSYKARPLAGVWATAPYLHNGSVPNLWEVLLPPAQRSKNFHVGGREFNRDRVGFADAGGSVLDTTIPGNSTPDTSTVPG